MHLPLLLQCLQWQLTAIVDLHCLQPKDRGIVLATGDRQHSLPVLFVPSGNLSPVSSSVKLVSPPKCLVKSEVPTKEVQVQSRCPMLLGQ